MYTVRRSGVTAVSFAAWRAGSPRIGVCSLSAGSASIGPQTPIAAILLAKHYGASTGVAAGEAPAPVKNTPCSPRNSHTSSTLYSCLLQYALEAT
jgi:hypothetical protein